MRIAIVNDLLIAVEALRRVIMTVPSYEIAWVARDGTEAVAQSIADPPDVILMDLLMPGMDGVEATRRIMLHSPCAILLVTATVSGLGSKVFEAMGYGALDAVNTPVLGLRGETEQGAELLAKITMIGNLIGKSASKKIVRTSDRGLAKSPRSQPPLIVIGASTGGPQALKTILSEFPANSAAAIVVIQHVDSQFAPGLVEWMNQQTALDVQLAREGLPLKAGTVQMAGTNDHLILQANLTLTHTPEPRDSFYRPSIDVFFRSVAKHWPETGIAVLLTGMGRDGAKGLLSLRSRGWHTIAQDQASCVVYGMPKAAVELGAAVEVLPISAIGLACMKGRRSDLI